MTPEDCKQLIQGSKAIWQSLGGDKNQLLPEEQVTRDFAYATVVAIKPIQKGEQFTKDNIWVKRPGTGEIKAEYFESVLGKRASQDIKTDTHLLWQHAE